MTETTKPLDRIDEVFLRRGRSYIQQKDLDALVRWHAMHCPVSHNLLRDTYGKCFAADDTERALKMFDAVTGEYRPRRAMFLALFRFVCSLAAFALVCWVVWRVSNP